MVTGDTDGNPQASRAGYMHRFNLRVFSYLDALAASRNYPPGIGEEANQVLKHLASLIASLPSDIKTYWLEPHNALRRYVSRFKTNGESSEFDVTEGDEADDPPL